ncbi:hypothetical protein AAC389_07015 [Rhodococcus qingshengii]|uniref:hypothetical protein n=1 Tax=Rhodococcus qingshengii TaxID=334542 RepID=UPI00311CA168
MTVEETKVDLADVLIDLHPQAFARLYSLADSPEATTAMRNTHLYMILSRPRITVSLDENPLFTNPQIRIRSAKSGPFEEVDFRRPEDITSLGLGSTTGMRFQGPVDIIEDGRRVRLRMSGSSMLDVDASHLAALAAVDLDQARLTEASKWEVQYVGMAFGGDGTRSAIQRLSDGHTTLSRILSEQGHSREVIVVPIQIAQSSIHISPGFANGGKPFDFAHFLDLNYALTPDGKRETDGIVKLVENTLISYFKPAYNKTLLKWPAVSQAVTFRDLGVRSILIGYEGSGDLAYLFSDSQPTARRSFVFDAELRGQHRLVDLRDDEWDHDRPISELAESLIRHGSGSSPSLRVFDSEVQDIVPL